MTATDAAGALMRLKALAHDTRYDTLRLLARGEHCVCDLEAALGLPQSRVSYHLGVLREAGLVVSEPRGKNVYYRLARGPLYRLGGDVLTELLAREGDVTHQTESVC
ncbi:ArsR/SmtB family transcription factor [Deinococcus maricopensis]|uniref:Transcriptional regulator, ArsR family n=1 Tax=Deinococcus maricopensis (strain DSM 21211 / LMG 22137 / NRRL B-23946 / LB-34) TaxID=709986 RepID=E8U312_DEIML|nr:metalloregulator ArsR/SmtB family transcription factor [Deinococcus maricopensis]ADV65750.1 transcriptional regulator, ArsR family [Deinococcus maricopensis DSM 21211]